MVLSHKCTQKAHGVRKPQSATAARLDKSQKASHELDKQRQKREEARDHALSFLSERDPLCDKCIGAEAELTS